MTHAWVELTGPDGHNVQAPTEAQLAAALSEIYEGDGAGADGIPPSAVLRFGYDDGLMYQMEVVRGGAGGGAIRFEEWSDRDCEIALASPRRMSAGKEDALQLWKWMAQRQVAKIRDQDWQE
ncbi:hypothetical protein [Pseudoduganella albidiflava]|uniref:Uncharacterized protein n=1 Tax=Pseudoduganella albidiflava TaxID=321983 RepID=A0A411X1G1_9BURK|nr:hypothetical protein [Pseudoduganella albidiflava]QBI02803.1 hypothetical protein EYF70_19585 [Pseudoduganella albidiflava]GGY56440.1 hypothetical protein GCM10007387_43660 [Pseudoduganella albidiflava]